MKTLPPDTVLRSGSHADPSKGMCVMECVAWLADEPHSDRPKCACPVLSAYARRLNDARWPSDSDRTAAMLPLVTLLAGSRSTPDVEAQRRWFLVDRAAREFAPMALDRAGRADDAARLRAMPAIVDRATAEPVAKMLRAADAAADAYAAAAYAAAAAAAADAYAARLPILRRAAEVLAEACAIGRAK